MFEIKDKELAGRIGKLVTKSGVIETPAFFPVVNPFKQMRDVPISKISEIGFNQLITNAFIIKQRLGEEALKVGVHRLLNFNGVVMTDSGAYQLLMYGGKRIRIDPIDIVNYQEGLGSDIAVIADVPTKDTATYEEALYSVEETLRRAELVHDLISESKTIWVLPVQGGTYVDLVRRSAKEALKLVNYRMYAIGSPVTVLEKYEFWKVIDMVATAKMILPPDKPVHLFGGGHPLIIPFMVALGIDTFDSASYILYAREGRYMTEYGTYRIEDLDYLPCECEVCRKYDAKELMELSKSERTRLIAIHNLHVINKEIKKVKIAIREGRLWELLEERARTHPSLREALNSMLKYMEFIERLDPRIKGDVHGIFLYDITSYHRPELRRHREYVVKNIDSWIKGKELILIPGNPTQKPFRNSKAFNEVLKKVCRDNLIKCLDEVVVFTPFMDLVPISIDQTYPYSQFEAPLNPEQNLIFKMFKAIANLVVKALSKSLSRVYIAYCEELEWAKKEVIEEFLIIRISEKLRKNIKLLRVKCS